MGIYPSKRTVPGDTQGIQQWVEVIESPGVTYQRTITASAWVEHRTDCYCCSCPDDEVADVYCRNHGLRGQRPCEEHNTSGIADPGGVMPSSVQTELARHRLSDPSASV